MVEVPGLCPKHRTTWWHRVLARLVACRRRPVLSRASFHITFCESPAQRGNHRSVCDLRRRDSAANSYRLSKSRCGCRSFVPQLPDLDLLSHLDPPRSAGVRCRVGRDRKISTAMVEAINGFRDLALVTWARADRLCLVARRRRLSDTDGRSLAISASCLWICCFACVRGQSALFFQPGKHSRRGIHRQHCLQCVSRSEARHSRGRTILFCLRCRAYVGICTRWRRDLRLRRRNDSILRS